MEERWLKEVLSDAKKAQDRSRAGASSSRAGASSSGAASSSSRSTPSSSRTQPNIVSPSSVIPNSVRNAPPEMRQAIRRKQNAEVS